MAPKRRSFPRSVRLTRDSDLRSVVREGKRIRTPYLDVRARASLLLHPRVGIVVPKYRRTSVERNRLRRHLREAVRLELLPQLLADEIVLRARVEAYDLSHDQLCDHMRELGVRLRSSSS